MRKLDKCQKMYESLMISNKLEDIVQEAFRKKNKSVLKKYRPVFAFACSFCLVFVILSNVSPDFVEATANIPFVKDLVRVVTVQKYKEETEIELVDVEMPALANTGNTELEKRVNEAINTKIDTVIEESKGVAREFKESINKMQEEEHTFEPMQINVNYTIKHSDENIVSFEIAKQEEFYSFYEEKYYFNIDLKTGKDITLEDCLGQEYQKIANAQIEEQMSQMVMANEATFFTKEDNVLLEHGNSFNGIEENQDFYINEQGKVVIVFPKYSIAPGYMGILEFEIEK